MAGVVKVIDNFIILQAVYFYHASQFSVSTISVDYDIIGCFNATTTTKLVDKSCGLVGNSISVD